MVLLWGAALLVGAGTGLAQAPLVNPGVIDRAVRQMVQESAGGQLSTRRWLALNRTPEPTTVCAIPLIEMPIDHHAIPLLRMPPLKRTAPMPMLRPRVCSKR